MQMLALYILIRVPTNQCHGTAEGSVVTLTTEPSAVPLKDISPVRVRSVSNRRQNSVTPLAAIVSAHVLQSEVGGRQQLLGIHESVSNSEYPPFVTTGFHKSTATKEGRRNVEILSRRRKRGLRLYTSPKSDAFHHSSILPEPETCPSTRDTRANSSIRGDSDLERVCEVVRVPGNEHGGDVMAQQEFVSATNPDEAVEAVARAVSLANIAKTSPINARFASEEVLMGNIRSALFRFPELVELLSQNSLPTWNETAAKWKAAMDHPQAD